MFYAIGQAHLSYSDFGIKQLWRYKESYTAYMVVNIFVPGEPKSRRYYNKTYFMSYTVNTTGNRAGGLASASFEIDTVSRYID